MENFGEKIRRKTFWSVFGWMERKENKWWDLGVFSPNPPKSFLYKMKRKLEGKIGLFFFFCFIDLLDRFPSFYSSSSHILLLLPLLLYYYYYYFLFRCDFFS